MILDLVSLCKSDSLDGHLVAHIVDVNMEDIEHIGHEGACINIDDGGRNEPTIGVDLHRFELHRPIHITRHLSDLACEFIKRHVVLVKLHMRWRHLHRHTFVLPRHVPLHLVLDC